MIKDFEEKLRRYAQLVMEVGLNIQPGDRLVLRSATESEDLALAMAEEAYRRGAAAVRVEWNNRSLGRLHYLYRSQEALEEVCPHMLARDMEDIERRTKYLSMVGQDPHAFDDCDKAKMAAATKAHNRAYLDFSSKMMANYTSWCVIGAPCMSWAREVFPDLPEAEALEKLWDLVFYTLRLDEGDALERWHQHIARLNARAQLLTEAGFTALHYTSERGTDFQVGLPRGHRFIAAEEANQQGQNFVANLPTEEIFTLPNCQEAEGIVYNTKPLQYNGGLIDGFWLRFEGGSVVDFAAEKGQELLAHMLDSDEGARRLGEVALVPYHSPISLSGVVFCETLFDENASCHLALGRAYPSCLADFEALSAEEIEARGANNSLIHVDFMIGDASLRIEGIRPDGSRELVFDQGDFTGRFA